MPPDGKRRTVGALEQRSAITRAIEELAADVGRKAIAGETPSAEIERLHALQAALAALPGRPGRFGLWAGLIGLLCLVVASAALTVRVPRTRLQLDLHTTTATLRLASDLTWDGNWSSAAGGLRVQHFTQLDLPPEYGQQTTSGREQSLDIAAPAGSVRLRHLSIGGGGVLTVSRSSDGGVDIAVLGAPFTGDIDVTGAVLASTDSGAGASLPAETFPEDQPPARFGFQYDGRGPVSALLHDRPRDSLVLEEMQVSGLSFFDERSSSTGESAFASQIERGTLTLTDADEQLTLSRGAALRLGDAHGIVSEMQVGKEGLHITFEGTVATAALGRGDFDHNIKPSLLEWLYHQQKVGFLWGAVTFLWGVIWSARKVLSGSG
jgi:hypothetical protein